MQLRFTLRGDGSSDIVLLPILRWLLTRHFPDVVIIEQFCYPRQWGTLHPHNLINSIRNALENCPCDVLFILRDSESADPEPRYREIQEAVQQIEAMQATRPIPVVPVRMTEAWLLIDEAAIRRASGKPNGRARVTLPPVKKLDEIADPKELLHAALVAAGELKGRKLKSFDGISARRLVAEFIPDFTPLRNLQAFQRLESSIGEFAAMFMKEAIPES